MRLPDRQDKPAPTARRVRHLRPSGCRRTMLPLLFLLAHERRIETGEAPMSLTARPRPWLN